jgi:hypothetical protein
MLKRFTAGMAVGYVLGARAGDKRYEQMTALADRALDVPLVSRVVDRGRDLAGDRGHDLLDAIRDRAFDTFEHAFGAKGRNGSTDDDATRDPGNADVDADSEEDDAAVEGDDDDDPDDSGDEDGDGDADMSAAHRDNTGRRRQAERRRSRRPERSSRSHQGRRSRLTGLAAAALERGRID